MSARRKVQKHELHGGSRDVEKKKLLGQLCIDGFRVLIAMLATVAGDAGQRSDYVQRLGCSASSCAIRL